MAWIVDADVVTALGDGRGVDAAWLAQCTPAADAWAQRQRAAAGYVDDPDVAPSADAKLGTILYAVALYRERGSTDTFASFDQLGAGIEPFGSSKRIRQLLGVGRAQTDRAPDPAVVPLRRRVGR